MKSSAASSRSSRNNDMYLADYHIHSTCSPDGKLSMAEIAGIAVQRGLQEICITDHVDTYDWHSGEKRTNYDWEKAFAQYREAVERWGDRIAVKLGAELSGVVRYPDEADCLMRRGRDLDFVIGSVHLAAEKFDWFDLYFIKEHDMPYYRDLIEHYLRDTVTLARWGRFHVLGHMTLPLRYLHEHLGIDMTFDDYMDAVEEIFRIIIPKGIGIECNTNRGGMPLPYDTILRRYREMGGEVITLGSDAHASEHIGCAIAARQQLLRDCGFRYFTTFTKGEPTFRPL